MIFCSRYSHVLTPYSKAVPAVIAKASAIYNPFIYAIIHSNYRFVRAQSPRPPHGSETICDAVCVSDWFTETRWLRRCRVCIFWPRRHGKTASRCPTASLPSKSPCSADGHRGQRSSSSESPRCPPQTRWVFETEWCLIRDCMSHDHIALYYECDKQGLSLVLDWNVSLSSHWLILKHILFVFRCIPVMFSFYGKGYATLPKVLAPL